MFTYIINTETFPKALDKSFKFNGIQQTGER